MPYTRAPIHRPSMEVIHPLTEEALGSRVGRALALFTPGTITWVANLAVFVPFGVSAPFLVREVWWATFSSGTAANVDVGVYDTAGTRLFSLGSTAKGSASTINSSSAMADYTLPTGDYYLAFACDNATAGIMTGWAPAAPLLAGFGVGEMATAFALPAPATIVPTTNALMPYFGLTGYTVAS